jgi:hypothetical protein
MSKSLCVAQYIRVLSDRNTLVALGILILSVCAVQKAHSAALPSGALEAQTASGSSSQSDPAAIQAMQAVMAQSGGAAAWGGIRSVEEKFTVASAGGAPSKTMLLLNDWSTNATRYRTAVQGRRNDQPDHNGDATFKTKIWTGNTVAVAEFDQARPLVSRLPAAAADVMLRNPEYILKISKLQKCESGSICIDVFRNAGSGMALIPEQQWKISSSTGLPVSIRSQVINAATSSNLVWKEVRYLQYGTQDGVTIPLEFEVFPFASPKETWTFVSLKLNPGFNPAALDQEAAQ